MRTAFFGVSPFKYLINDNGDVFSLRFKNTKKLKVQTTDAGYKFVMISSPFMKKQRAKYVHCLVGQYFLDNPFDHIEKYEVHHIDHDPSNNNVSNLMYVSHRLNLIAKRGKCAQYDERYKKWRSKVARISLGLYKNEQEAIDVSRNFKINLFYEVYKAATGVDPPEKVFEYNPRKRPKLFKENKIAEYFKLNEISETPPTSQDVHARGPDTPPVGDTTDSGDGGAADDREDVGILLDLLSPGKVNADEVAKACRINVQKKQEGRILRRSTRSFSYV